MELDTLAMAETRIATQVEIRNQAEAKVGVKFSLIYTTARAEPRLDWTIDGLEAQAIPGDEIQLIVIDALNRAPETIGYRTIGAITDLVSTAPKPSPWQGPQRIARRDFWAASSARNTGIVLAGSDYIAFLDDRCRLGPRWLAEIRKGAGARASVLCGAYDKLDGSTLIPDHRMKFRPKGQRGCSGGWLYGGNFALPISWLFHRARKLLACSRLDLVPDGHHLAQIVSQGSAHRTCTILHGKCSCARRAYCR